MAEFSKESLSFLEAVGDDIGGRIGIIPNSADRISPGEVLIFRYNPQTISVYRSHRGLFATNQKVVLIVGCNRGEGVFPGKTGTLISCFKLIGNSAAVVSSILENLYTSESGGDPVKERTANYYGKIKESLISLLGENTFRTYKLGSMRRIYKVDIGEEGAG